MSASTRVREDGLELAGEVTADNVLTLRQQGEAWLASLPPDTSARIDLSAASPASSVLLSLLLCWRRKASEQRIMLDFTGTPQALTALSHLNGISRWLTGPA